MKITNLKAQNFMLFDSLDLDFSSGVNVVFGENSTGKTAILKALYSVTATCCDIDKKMTSGISVTNTEQRRMISEKLKSVYCPAGNKLKNLSKRIDGSDDAAAVNVSFNNDQFFKFGFSKTTENLVGKCELKFDYIPENGTPLYIPPKEIISSAGNFVGIYDKMNIGMDQTFRDLAGILLLPERKTPMTAEEKSAITAIEKILNGTLMQEGDSFFLKTRSTKLEISLLSEGYKKLATLAKIIYTGYLNKDSIIFWDEPEANLNPVLIQGLCNILMDLANMGVQIFVTTHSYFVQQEFNLVAGYRDRMKNKDKPDIRFISLYRDPSTNKVEYEAADELVCIEHNAVMEEFDAVYNRELELQDE